MTYPLAAREPIKVIADILAAELGLIKKGAKCQVMIENERFNIPETNGIYIALSYLGPGRVLGSKSGFVPTVGGATEEQSVTIMHLIQIDIMSYDSSARTRKEEIAMALASVLAQQQMELNNLQIARHPSSFLDASMLEETKRLNRFTTTVAVTALFTKSKAVEYFDQFPTPEVHVNA